LDPIKSGKRGIKFTVIRNLNLEKKVNEIVDVRKVGFRVREMDEIQEDLIYCMNAESWNGSVYGDNAGRWLRYRTNGECGADGTFRLVRDEKNPNQFKMYNVRTKKIVGIHDKATSTNHKGVMLLKESDSKNQLWIMSKSARSKGDNSTFHFLNVGTNFMLDVPGNQNTQMSVYIGHHKGVNQAFYLKVAGEYKDPKPVDIRKVGFRVREMDQIQEDLVYCMNVENWNGSLYSDTAGNMVKYRTNVQCAADGTFRLVRDEENPSQFKMYNVRTQRAVGVGGQTESENHKGVILEKESDSKNQLWVMSKSARSKGVNSTFHFVNVGTNFILDTPANKDTQMSVYIGHHKNVNQAFYLQVAGEYVEPKPVDVRMEGFRVVDLEQFKDDLVYCIKAEFTGHALYSTKDNNSVRHGTSEDCGEESLFRVIHDKTFIDEFVVKFQNIKTQMIVTAGERTHQTIYLKEDLTGVEGQNTQRWIMTPGQRSTFEVSFFNIVNVESKHILDVESGKKGDRRMIANKNHNFEGNQAFSFTVIKPYVHADYEIMIPEVDDFHFEYSDSVELEVEDPNVLKFDVVDPNDCSVSGSDCSNFFKNLFSDFDENQHYCIAPLTSNNELEFSTSCILNTTFRFVRSSEFENAFRIVYSKNNTELLTYDNNLSNIMISEAKDNKKMLQRWNISQSKNGTFSIQNLENNNYLTYMVPDMEDKAYNLGLSKTPDANGRSSFVLIKQPSFTPEFSSNQLYCLQFNKKITKTTLVPSLESNSVARTNSDCQPEDLWRLIPANRASHSYYLVSFMGHRVLSEGRSQNITLEKLKYLERQAWEPVKSNSGIFSFKNGQTGAILALTNDGEVALVDGDEVMDVQSRYFQVRPMPCSKALD
jgi:hypothetical protein